MIILILIFLALFCAYKAVIHAYCAGHARGMDDAMEVFEAVVKGDK